MDWDNVRVFLAVARAGQFVAAARRLRLDHATVSRRIAALEAALGAQLFERLTTGARLTSAGERFLAAAEQMESAFLHAQAEVSGLDVELSGDVRIGAPDGFATYYLAEALGDFIDTQSRRCACNCAAAAADPAGAARGRHRRRARQAGGRPLRRAEAHRLQPRPLRQRRLSRRAQARRARRRPRRHRLIGYVEEYAFSGALDYVRELYGGAPTQFECASAATQFEALARGLGLCVVHDYIARRFADLKPVLPGRRATRTYWLVTHEDTRGLGRIRAVCEHLIACVTRDRAMFV